MPSVSLTFAGALALLNLWLAFRVIQVRRSGKVLVGDGDNPLLVCRMRAQANFVEYTPFVLILMALIEIAGGPKPWLWGIGIVYVLGRIVHAFGMDRRTMPNPARGVGACVTWAILLGLGLWAIWMASHAPAAVHYL
jgi:uncharacterized membrane protein YecN with MAPEG domain